MFGSDKKAAAPATDIDTLIGARTTIKGDLHFSGGLMRIDGKVVGTVRAESGTGAVIEVSDKGAVEGELRAPNVVVNGKIDGDIIAADRVRLLAQARVNGNIHYKILEMAAGAQVSGQIRRAEDVQQLSAPAAATTATVSEPLKLESSSDSKLSAKVEPAKESKVEAEVLPKEARGKRV